MIYIFFYHGRHSPDEELDGWGFKGPVVGPYSSIQVTYGSAIKVSDLNGDRPIEFTIKDGFVEYLGSFYGDFEIFDETILKTGFEGEYDKTNEVFHTKEKDLPLLINDKEEWVKVYIERSLKDGTATVESALARRTGRRQSHRRGEDS